MKRTHYRDSQREAPEPAGFPLVPPVVRHDLATGQLRFWLDPDVAAFEALAMRRQRRLRAARWAVAIVACFVLAFVLARCV